MVLQAVGTYRLRCRLFVRLPVLCAGSLFLLFPAVICSAFRYRLPCNGYLNAMQRASKRIATGIPLHANRYLNAKKTSLLAEVSGNLLSVNSILSKNKVNTCRL